MKKLIVCIALLLGGSALVLLAQQVTKVYFDYGGDKLVVASGGEIEVQSGGIVDVESGGALKFAGTTFTASDYALDTDLANYALLAGDADGQTIQGMTGVEKARIDISGSEINAYGGGAEGNACYLNVAATDFYLWAPNTGALQAENHLIIVSGQTPPTNANDPCTAGDFIPTSGFIYYCVATDTWQRVAIATWP